LEPIDAIARKSNLSGRSFSDDWFRIGECLLERVQLGRRREAYVSVGGCAKVKLDEPLGARVRLSKYDQTDDSERGQKSGEYAQGYK
jgi:hypothetical protein